MTGLYSELSNHEWNQEKLVWLRLHTSYVCDLQFESKGFVVTTEKLCTYLQNHWLFKFELKATLEVHQHSFALFIAHLVYVLFMLRISGTAQKCESPWLQNSKVNVKLTGIFEVKQ